MCQPATVMSIVLWRLVRPRSIIHDPDMLDDTVQALHKRLVCGVLLQVIVYIFLIREVRDEAVRKPALDPTCQQPSRYANGGRGLTT
jgi:hypothetical protein